MKDTRARSLVVIMIVIAVFSLFLRVIIEKIIKISISQNESVAQSTLKLISTALENYANDNRNVYPGSLSVLTQSIPPYLEKNYISHSPLKGYIYSCLKLELTGYSCSATPVKCQITGKAVYSVTTGGLLVSEDCSRKE